MPQLRHNQPPQPINGSHATNRSNAQSAAQQQQNQNNNKAHGGIDMIELVKGTLISA
jgi:hypothetical protein